MSKEHGAHAGWMRGAGGVLLLALLALCGYIGARQPDTQTVSVPVVRQMLETQETTVSSMEAVCLRLSQEREQELALLQGVIDDETAQTATRENALAQQTQIVQRMEQEAQTEALLLAMGFDGVVAVSGAQGITVVTTQQNALDEADRVRMLDAVSGQTGLSAENIKIILVKK